MLNSLTPCAALSIGGLALYTSVGSVNNTVKAAPFTVVGAANPFINPKYKSQDIGTFLGAKYTVPLNDLGLSVGVEHNMTPSKTIQTLCTSGTTWGNKISNGTNLYLEPTYGPFAVRLGYAQQKIKTTDAGTGQTLFMGNTHGSILGASWVKEVYGWDLGLNLDYATYAGGSLARSTFQGIGSGYNPHSTRFNALVSIGRKF